MLDQYITGLVKEARVQNKLDSHLEEMVKKAEAETELEAFLDNATAEDLAKLAGVELPEGTCPQCASQMQKLGSIYQCPCGMVKKAKAVPPALAANAAKTVAVQNPSPGAEIAKPAGAEKPAKVSGCKTASIANFAEAVVVAEGNVKLAFEVLANSGYEDLGFTDEDIEKNAFLGAALKGLGSRAASMGAKAMANPSVAKGVSAAKGVGQKVMATKPAQMLQKGYQQAGTTVGRGLSQAKSPALQRAGRFISKHPGASAAGLATGAGAATGALTAGEGRRGRGMLAGALGGLGGGMIGGGLAGAATRLTPASKTVTASDKTAAEEIIDVGTAAGRMLAKVALQLDPAEVGEAIEEAKAREDIPGRAQSWGRGGAAIGGIGGGALGAGAGLGGALLARKFGLGPAAGKLIPGIAAGVGGAAGAAGGGMLGQRIGREEGAEEAAADRLVSMLRGRRAYMAGGQRGFQAGAQRGYEAGRSAGGPGPQ
jgi:hypothetical protein